MHDVLVATRAIFFPLHALRVQPLVLHGEVIAVLALGATEDDFLACHDSRLRAAFSDQERGAFAPRFNLMVWKKDRSANAG
jgi:hypothetical protein